MESFDINEIKITSKNYDAVQTYAFIEPEDEKKVLNWISETVYVCKDDQDTFAYEFKEGKNLEYDEIIKELDLRYSNTPEFTKNVVNIIKRPSLLSNSIKEKYGYKCMICEYPGFLKKNGGKYAEVHHMIELNENAPKTLQSWNLLVVCRCAIKSYTMPM